VTRTWLNLLDDERRRDLADERAWRREAARNRGVCWSGPPLEPPRPRSEEDRVTAARTRHQALQDWRASPAGRYLAAVSRAQQAAEAAHLAGESARAAVARGFPSSASSCHGAAEALEAQGLAIVAAARAARDALAAS
jgi:hypothetical protein